jgi:hypothetical protein
MIPYNIDPRRFEILLSNGLTGDELHEFFVSQKNVLIMAGEKVQNTPRDLRGAIRHFSAGAHSVLGKWLGKQNYAGALIDEDQIVPRYRSVEELGVRYPKEEHTALDRQTIRALYQNSPNEELLAFLRTQIPDGQVPQAPKNAMVAFNDWQRFLRNCQSKDIGEPVPQLVLQSASTLLAAIKHKERSLLPPDDVDLLRAYDGEVTNAAVQEQLNAVPKRGLTIADLSVRDFDSEQDYSEYQVVATRYSSKDRENLPWFAVVDAFADGRTLFTLRRDDMNKAIPTAGEIVIHKDRGISSPPVGEARLYEVEMIQNDYRAKVRAKELLDRLTPIVSIPCDSSDAQAVRRAITEMANTNGLMRAVFLTSDNVCLRPRAGLNGVSRPDFDWQVDGWHLLEGYELPSGTYALEPLPAASLAIDCSPLARVARRLLKLAGEKSQLALTKSQRDGLAALLSNEDLQVSDAMKQRLAQNLSTIDHSNDDYAHLLDLVMNAPRIGKDIEERVHAAVDKRLAEKAGELQKIDRLKQERSSLEKAIVGLEEDREDAAKAIRAVIRKTFASATKKEIETLGEASLLSALMIGAQAPVTQAKAVAPATVSTLLTSSVHQSDPRQIVDVLRACGFSSEIDGVLADALELAFQCGVAIVLMGADATHLAEQLAPALSKKAFRKVDIGLGLTSESIPEEWVQSSDTDLLVMSRANLSDVALYAPSILTQIVKRTFVASTTGIFPGFLISGSSAAAALPWPTEIAKLALKVDLDSEDEIASGDQVEGGRNLPTRAQRALLSKVERKASAGEYSRSALHLVRRLILRR